LLVAVLGPAAPAAADEELGHIFCLSARAAIEAKDFTRAREQIRKALNADPASTEALLLLGHIAAVEGKKEAARKHYLACARALAAKRIWSERDLPVRAELTTRLLASEDDHRTLSDFAKGQARRWIELASSLARQGSRVCARAAADAAASFDPETARQASVEERATDRLGWSPLLTKTAFMQWRPLRADWRYEKGLLACQSDEGLIAAPPKSTARDLQFEVRARGKAKVRVDLGRFAVQLDFGAKRVRAACQSPGAAFRAELKEGRWHTVALIHRRAGVEAVVDGTRLGLFRYHRAEGLVGVQVVGKGAAVRALASRLPQNEPEEPELPEWMRRLPRRRRPLAARAPTTPENLLAAGRSLEAIIKLAREREPTIDEILALSSALEQRGLCRWAAEVCDAGLQRGLGGEMAKKLALHRAHLAYRLGDAARAVKLARKSGDESESTLVLLGDALKQMGKRAEAAAAWRKALARNPLRDDIMARLQDAGLPARRASGVLPLERAVELLKPTVVVISGAPGGGSGFFLTPDGLLLTNYHVIANLEVPTVTAIFRHGANERRETFPIGDVVASDRELDLAAVHVAPRGLRFSPVRLWKGGVPKVGSKVMVIGSPGFGEIRLDYTVTQGIVSSGLRTLRGARYVQTDAAINPGNSGGPVFNERGEVIGVATAGIMFAQNVAFFVPTSLICDYLKREDLP